MDHTILITGSTDGVGKLTASKLAKEGYTVIVHGRNPQKLADVVEEIKASTGNEKVLGFVADFSDLVFNPTLRRFPGADPDGGKQSRIREARLRSCG